MRQLVGCATCARVDWIDEFVPCYLIRECLEELRAQVNGGEGALRGQLADMECKLALWRLSRVLLR